jgi:superfamily II DNA helicase RecQ
MRMAFFTIPIHDADEASTVLNQFLSSHRVMAVDRQFVQDGSNSAWSLCVSFVPTSEVRAAIPARRGVKVDYRDVLNEQDFALFARLRAVRKQLAEAEGVPAYAIFTKDQLAAMVRDKTQSLTALQTIDGVGEARATKYGGAFLPLLLTPPPDQSPAPVAPGAA